MTTDAIENAIDKLHDWAFEQGLDVGVVGKKHVARLGRTTYAYVDESGNTFMTLDGSGEYFEVSPKWDPLDVAYDLHL